MSLTIEAITPALTIDSDGVARVGGTRVTLESIVAAFDEGETPEEIVAQYAPLELADVYEVIAFYLRHRPAVEAYLRQCDEQAGAVRRLNEQRFNQPGLRERLLARKPGDTAEDATSGG